MQSLSEAFTNTVMEFAATASHNGAKSRVESAAAAYEQAREEFLAAVARLNDYMLNEIISTRSSMPEPWVHR